MVKKKEKKRIHIKEEYRKEHTGMYMWPTINIAIIATTIKMYNTMDKGDVLLSGILIASLTIVSTVLILEYFDQKPKTRNTKYFIEVDKNGKIGKK